VEVAVPFRFEPETSFDAETAQAIAEAFYQVCTHLDDAGQPDVVRDVISERIVKAAKEGERDPIRLREIVLESFGFGLKRIKPTQSTI
jgi:hypothetical protein